MVFLEVKNGTVSTRLKGDSFPRIDVELMAGIGGLLLEFKKELTRRGVEPERIDKAMDEIFEQVRSYVDSDGASVKKPTATASIHTNYLN